MVPVPVIFSNEKCVCQLLGPSAMCGAANYSCILGFAGFNCFFLRFRTISLCNILHSSTKHTVNEEKIIISPQIISIYRNEFAASYVELLKLIFLGRAVHAIWILCNFPIYSRWVPRNDIIKKCNLIKLGHCAGWRSFLCANVFVRSNHRQDGESLWKMHSNASNRFNYVFSRTKMSSKKNN